MTSPRDRTREGPSACEDGDFDLSYYLAEKKGFLPILIPIAEPAVGYGGAFAGIFLHKSLAELKAEAEKDGTGKRKPPSITVVGGMGTENGTWGGFGGHLCRCGETKRKS